MNEERQEPDADTTQPPVSSLRYETPAELYAEIPQIATLTQNRPQEDEGNFDYLRRLSGSTTPEEAITFTSFAAHPKMAIWWAYECIRTTSDVMDQPDRHLMEKIANWISYTCDENRYEAIRNALWAPRRSPAVCLALAVGWSGGAIAPNDLAPVPQHKAPRAINAGLLSCIARSDFTNRSVQMARFIDQAATLYRVY